MHSTHVAVNLMHLCNNLKAIRTYVDYIGVAVQERGSLLREMGIDTPIIMLGDVLGWLSLAGYIGLMGLPIEDREEGEGIENKITRSNTYLYENSPYNRMM